MKHFTFKILIAAIAFVVPSLTAKAGGWGDEVVVDGVVYGIDTDNNEAHVEDYDSSLPADVVIPEYINEVYKVTSIDWYAFQDCYRLATIKIPNTVTCISEGAFLDCFNLKSISVPNSVSCIEREAFSGCSDLLSVTIPRSVTDINESAFSNCSSLTSVEIPNSVISIGDGAFEGCSGLVSVTIPRSVTDINESAFSNCSSLTSVEIPNSVISIGDGAFEGCSGLVSVTIPNSVTSLDNAFNGCTSLTSIFVDENNPNYCDIDGVLFNKEMSTLSSYPAGREGTYAVPGSVTEVLYGSFDGCISLTSITIPSSVVTIGSSFYNCSSLTSIIVDENNPNFCDKDGVLFSKDMTRLIRFPEGKAGEYEIPNSVTKVIDAFSQCSKLTSITISSSVIDFLGIWGCSNLKSIIVDKSNPNYCDIDGVLFSKDGSELIYYPNGRVGDYRIPNSVMRIGWDAFRDCAGVTSVIIPNSVEEIESGAFRFCTSLSSVTIPNSVAKMGDRIFEGCSNLKSVKLPESITVIGYSFFSNCSSLTSVSLPNSVLRIDMHAFEGCTSLSSITIPNSVKWIEYAAFEGCTSLNSIVLPSSLLEISDDAFRNCSNLANVTCLSTNCPNAFGAFYRTPIISATLYVPSQSVEQYKSTEPWSEFGSIIGIDVPDSEDKNAGWIGKYNIRANHLEWNPTREYPDNFEMTIEEKEGALYITSLFGDDLKMYNDKGFKLQINDDGTAEADISNDNILRVTGNNNPLYAIYVFD